MKNYWSLKLSRVVTFLAAFCPFFSSAQFSPPEERFKAEESYLYPINPGVQGSLAGTMGELRSTHFHSGIDIRTNNVIGIPVLASKSGYVFRAGVSPSGYGNVIYLKHADGSMTVYGHLDRFRSPLAEYVVREQYRRKASSVNLFFRADQFRVKRGDTIGFSGNSGSSGGPHLHFEARDPNNQALNPLMVGEFSEIVDNSPPTVEKIALKTLDVNSRINDRFGRFEFHALRVGDDYIFPTPILATGTIGVEILAKDKLSPHSRFYGGVNYIEMAVDSQMVFHQSIDKINFAASRAILTLMDYEALRNNGTRFYKLYLDDGNSLNFYEDSPGDGKISVRPGQNRSVRITMTDSYGNSSNLSFTLQHASPTREAKFLETPDKPIEHNMLENVMMVSATPCEESNNALVYMGNSSFDLEPAYAHSGRAVYLLDLRRAIPDSIVVCGNTLTPDIKAAVPSNREYSYYSDLVDIRFPASALYDTVYLNISHKTTETGNQVYTIGPENMPLNQSISVFLRPLDVNQWDSKLAVYHVDGASQTYLGGRWENGGIHFSTREFGDFMIMRDTVAPAIRPLSVNRTVARFRIGDDLSGIAKFEANLNGKWVLMLYDGKTNTIWSEKLNKAEPLRGSFTLEVTDLAGNKSTYTTEIP